MSISDQKPIVIIADNMPDMGFLSVDFADAGYEAVFINSPEETKKQFIQLWNQDNSPKIVLLDVALGSETGWEVAKFIRKYDRDCLIFMFTGHKNPIVDKIQVRQSGANGIIYKPKDGAEILAQIKLYEKERERKTLANGQGDGHWFTTREIAVYTLNFIFIIAVVWFCGRMDYQLYILTSNQKLQELKMADVREKLAAKGLLNNIKESDK